MIAKAKIIVLRVVKYSEADLIVHGLSSEGERLHLLAKGALKSRKRFGGGLLEATHYIEVTYKQSKSTNSDLHRLDEAQMIEDFPGVRTDYDRLQLALYFLQVISQLSFAGLSEGRPVFDLLGNALKAVEQTKDLNLLRSHFEIKLMHLHGVLPPQWQKQEFLQRPIREHQDLVPFKSELKNEVISYHLKNYLDGHSSVF